jgi:hypothetical protein
VRLRTRVSTGTADWRDTVLDEVLHVPELAHGLVCHERVPEAVRFDLGQVYSFMYGRVEAPDFTLCYFRGKVPGHNAGLVQLGGGAAPEGYRLGESRCEGVETVRELPIWSASYIKLLDGRVPGAEEDWPLREPRSGPRVRVNGTGVRGPLVAGVPFGGSLM